MVHHVQVGAGGAGSGLTSGSNNSTNSNGRSSNSCSCSSSSSSQSWQFLDADKKQLQHQHHVHRHPHQLVVQPFQLQQITNSHKFQHHDFFQHFYLQRRQHPFQHHQAPFSIQHEQVRHQIVKVADSLYGPILRVHCGSPTGSSSSLSTSSSPTSSPSSSPTTCSQLSDVTSDTTTSSSSTRLSTISDSSSQEDDDQDKEDVYVVKEIDLSQARRRLCLQREADNPFQERKVANFLLQSGGHDHIVKYHQIHVDESHHKLIFVMEHCPKGDLWSFLMHAIDAQPQSQMPPRSHEKLQPVVPERQALKWLGQLVSAVHFLHSHDIAHRDLSLENVLLTDGDDCKLIDFGLSVSPASQMCQDQVGKNYYMAPEIVQGNGQSLYDPRKADVWSLGVMLFMLLTGSVLCQIASASNRTLQIVAQKDGIQRIVDLWQGQVSPSTVDLLTQMLQVDPTERMELTQVAHHEALEAFCVLK